MDRTIRVHAPPRRRRRKPGAPGGLRDFSLQAQVRRAFAGAFRRRTFSVLLQAEDGIRDLTVTGVQTCALPISRPSTGGTRSAAAGLPATSSTSAGSGAAGLGLTHDGGSLAATTERTRERKESSARQIGRASCRERV